MDYKTKFFKEFSLFLYKSLAYPSTRLIPAVALGITLIAFGAACIAALVADPSEKPVKLVLEEIPLPDLIVNAKKQNLAIQKFSISGKFKKNENVYSFLKRLGINDDQAEKYFKKKTNIRFFRKIQQNQQFDITLNGEGRFLSLDTIFKNRKSKINQITIERVGNNFLQKKYPVKLEKRLEMRSAKIISSLFAATDSANIPNSIANQIVNLFSSKIDFASDLRKGDNFQVIYETLWVNGNFIQNGRVLGAGYYNKKKAWKAIWFGHSKKGLRGYYDLKGRSLKKAFLKSPLRFSRVTSGFSMRKHPISGKWKQHKGIDFAAPTGTPILATGNGIIKFKGSKRGYGKMVIIQHGKKYSTAYAHMSRFNKKIKKGKKVFKGQVIGYVGTTGWSTGPHCHYEFRVNGIPKNPNKIVVPRSEILSGASLLHYKKVSKEISRRLNIISSQVIFLASK